jgi:hemerythrin
MAVEDCGVDKTGVITVDWKADLEVGDALIDAQHRAFLTDLEKVMAAIQGGAERNVVLRFYTRFLADLTRHFHDEEEMLARVDFPDLDGHADDHRQLLSSVTAIESLLVASTGATDMHLVIRSLLAGLVDHLVAGDTRYKAWLKRQG